MSKKQPIVYKKLLILALEKNLGIITPACKEVGVSRDTFYRYYEEDVDFRREVDSINDITLDFVENQLLRKIKDGSERSILFYMKYKARKRGYTDSLDITTGGDKITEIKLIQIKNRDIDGDAGN